MFDGTFYALHAATGAQRWNLSTANYIFASASASADGATLFVAGEDYFVYAYALASADGSCSTMCVNRVC